MKLSELSEDYIADIRVKLGANSFSTSLDEINEIKEMVF